MFDLTGKVALVTGSTRGIGRAIAGRMAEQGASVIISSRKTEACTTTAADFAASGHDVFAQACDIASKDDLSRLVEATLKRYGRIDILICNAATSPVRGPSYDVSDELWAKIMGTNVQSTFWLCNMVLPQMAARGEGAVIVISSIVAMYGAPQIGIYAVSKAAEIQLVRNLAMEWGSRGIRVNTIAPGLIKTDLSRGYWQEPERQQAAERRIPLRRIGDPDDIAGIAVALCAPAGRFVTGQVLAVDGGMTVWPPI
jgi:NAD(P)-dependent dehydrogenase (short-subunit alcohol dehydrogenase family)